MTRDYPPAIGGISTHVKELVEALKETGVETEVYVGRNDIKTLLLPFDIPLKRYDLVHVQSLPYGAFVFGVPLVVTVHSPVLEEFAHYRKALKVASIPAAALEKVSLSRASAILAVSEQSKDNLVGRYGLAPGRIEVVGNGVEFEKFAAAGAMRADGAERRMVVVSRLEARKNVAEAIEAVSKLPAGSWHLDIAGTGSEMGMLANLAKRTCPEGAVGFLGRVDASALPSVYARASIFLTTSNSEGFGLSLLDAMSSGCACVVSDIPAHRALIDNGANGVIYRDETDLVEVLRELLRSPERARALGDAAKVAAKDRTWSSVANRVSEAYRRVAPA